MRYSDLLFSLKSHINLVREHLELRLTALHGAIRKVA